jgi:AbrB family looped-hinge helix DNA binding protein
MERLTLTSRGQVTFRKEVREHLGVKPGERLELRLLPGGRLELAAEFHPDSAVSFATIARQVEAPGGRYVTDAEIDAAISDGWAGRRGR